MLKSAFKSASNVPDNKGRTSKSSGNKTQHKERVNRSFESNSLTNLFAPTTIDELCVATKKVDEIREWLSTQKHSRICLLSGPSGAGKTAVVTLLAKELNYEIKEWINPVDVANIRHLGDQNDEHAYPVSQVSLFQSFLFHGSRYKSVFSACKKRLLLVEDFPNALLSDPPMFFQLLEEYIKLGRAPLIFIASDSRSRNLDIPYKLFPDLIKDKLCIANVEFNPISTTLLQKAMKRFCQLISQMPPENYKVPSKEIIDSIVISSQGDIRNAVINLSFASIACEKGKLETIPITAPTKTKKSQQRALKSIGCDKSVTQFHALGRVFNPKWDENKHFIHKPDEITDNFITEPRKIQSLIYANYVKHFTHVEDIVIATGDLSLSDIILSEYRENDLAVSGLDLCIRSLMVSNTSPVSGWMPINKTKHTNLKDKAQKVEYSDGNWLSLGLYRTDCTTYTQIMSHKPNTILEAVQLF